MGSALTLAYVYVYVYASTWTSFVNSRLTSYTLSFSGLALPVSLFTSAFSIVAYFVCMALDVETFISCDKDKNINSISTCLVGHY